VKVPPFPQVQSTAEALRLQRELVPQLRLTPLRRPARRVAGLDVSFDDAAGRCHAAVVLMEGEPPRVVEQVSATRPITFPYITGLLSFREIPVLLACLEQLSREPDLLLCDGQGIAHPRGIGLASHLGLILGRPSVGCAKTRLLGTFVPPAPGRGSVQPLLHQGREVGAVVRTRDRVKPLFVSPGHLVTTPDAIRETLAWATRYRLPEPCRLAHHLANATRLKSTPHERNRP